MIFSMTFFIHYLGMPAILRLAVLRARAALARKRFIAVHAKDSKAKAAENMVGAHVKLSGAFRYP